MITVMRTRYVPSYPRHEQGERVYVLDLGQALSRTYSTDAHFTQYTSPVGRRLCHEAIGKVDAITLDVITFDLDCPDVHGTPEPAPESWRLETGAKMAALHDAHPNCFFYWTRGGCRIVYRQPTPTLIQTRDDARAWAQEYAIAGSYLRRRFDLQVDPACGDWTRLFRLPHATRESGGKPESWPTIGDPHNIGVLYIEPSEADFAAARKASKAFRDARALDFRPSNDNGHGLLFHALRGRGDVGRPHGSNAYVIRCPRESQHTCGRTGDGSTVLYLPARGEQVGAVHCMHSHCVGLAVRDWLRCFTSAELAAARRAAGIERAA